MPSEFAPPPEESSSAGALVAIIISPAVLKGLSELDSPISPPDYGSCRPFWKMGALALTAQVCPTASQHSNQQPFLAASYTWGEKKIVLIFLFLNHQAGLPIEQAGLSWGCRASGSGWSPATGTSLSVHLSTTYTIAYKEHAPAPQHVHRLYVSLFLLSLHIFRYHFSFLFNGKPKGSAKSLQNSVLFQWLESSMSKLKRALLPLTGFRHKMALLKLPARSNL